MRFYYFIFVLFALAKAQQNECGSSIQSSGFIVGGGDLEHGEFPWMVALLKKGDNPPSFFCSGTLVSSQNVVTGENQKGNYFKKLTVVTF